MARNGRWKRLNIALESFREHIEDKGSNKFDLTEVDLLHTSNFKGGNASICEPLDTLREKLGIYSKILHEIGDSQLVDLQKDELGSLVSPANSFLQLTLSPGTKIYGFGPTYASAVLSAHYTDLLPVIDKWVLNGAGIVEAEPKKPIDDIEVYYGELIDRCWCHLQKNSGLTLRGLDLQWYTK
jgi:hypothetical protein